MVNADVGQIGRSSYDRLRAKAMVLTLRYTALRLGDVAMLERDRISRDGDRWRIFLRTEKSGKPVFLPIPFDMKAALDACPLPRKAGPDCKWFFWNGITNALAMKGMMERTLRAVFKESCMRQTSARPQIPSYTSHRIVRARRDVRGRGRHSRE